MRKEDLSIFLGLCLLAVFIWLRDTAWMTTSDDTLPILIGLPLFAWLGSPWKFTNTPSNYPSKNIILGVSLFVIGIGLNFTLLLTMGWMVFLYTWLKERLDKNNFQNNKKLLLLPFMSFPWVSLDFTQTGWWFRLSGAWITEVVFASWGFDVNREGTLLNINGIPISIEVACAGLNTLQSMLISGTIVAFIFLKDTWRFWLSLPLIILMTWVANTLRIIFVCLLALWISPAFVMGSFHVWGGWGVLMLMFGLCWLLFSFLEPTEKGKET